MSSNDGRPLYLAIADRLRSRIAEGVYAVGDTLPSTKELMKETGASITAVRAAIKILQAEGVAVGHPGKGVYVRRLPEAEGTDNPVLDELRAIRAELADLRERVLAQEEQILEKADPAIVASVNEFAKRLAALESKSQQPPEPR